MPRNLSPTIVRIIVDICDELANNAETQLIYLKNQGGDSKESLLHGHYTYWKNYRSAMRDYKRIAQSRRAIVDGDI